MRTRNRLHKFIMAALAGLLVLVAAGCSGAPAKNTQTQRSMKVMFWDESYFFQQYGDLFAMQYPNVDIEVINTQSIYNSNDGEITDYNKAVRDFIDKEQPDVVMVSMENYEKMVAEGTLMELDTFIERDKYNTETIYPALIDMLKEKGGGKLYGLSPSFSGSAVFYNTDLFNKYGIELPHDGMTWQEIMDLARRFPTDGDEKTRIYGYGANYSMGLNNLVQMIASAEGLNYINPDTLKITINTDSWKRVYKMALDATEAKAVYNPTDNGFMGGSMEDYYKSQLFLMGRMAMTIGDPYMLQNMKEAKNAIKDYKPFQLGMVAGPVDPADPETTRSIYFSEIFAIRGGSPNADAAWDFLKFVNGEDYARIKSRTLNNGLLSRMGFNKEYDGNSLDVFYKLKPKLGESNYSRLAEKIPNDFYQQYQPILDREIGLVEQKKKSLDEALKTIEAEGQAVLDKSVKEKEANKGKDKSTDAAGGSGDSGSEGDGSSGTADSPVIVTESTTE